MVRILSVGTYLPGEPVSNDRMEQVFGIRADWIDNLIGTETRHLAANLHQRTFEDDLASMGFKAADRALQAAPIARGDIELVVLATATPDHLMPATVNLIADRLGLNGVATYQVQAGCSGAYQALDVACQFLRAGRFRSALVVGADVINKYLDFDRDFSTLRSSELINLALFGDGAGAAVLSTDAAHPGLAIRHVLNRFEGVGRKPGQIMNWFGSAADARGKQAAKEDYKAIEAEVPRMAAEVLQELLAQTGWSRGGVDFFLPPQLAGHMTNRIVERLELPGDRVINCVAQTGNNGNALPFIQIERLRARMRPGQRALAVAIESSKWIKVGMALEG